MKNKLLIGLIVVLLIIITSVIIINIPSKDNKNLNGLLNEQDGINVFEKLENLLKKNGINYDIYETNYMIYGALMGYRYNLSSGDVIEVYFYDEKSTHYNNIINTNKITVLGTDVTLDVYVVEKYNLVVYYKNVVDKINIERLFE